MMSLFFVSGLGYGTKDEGISMRLIFITA